MKTDWLFGFIGIILLFSHLFFFFFYVLLSLILFLCFVITGLLRLEVFAGFVVYSC